MMLLARVLRAWVSVDLLSALLPVLPASPPAFLVHTVKRNPLTGYK